MIYLIFTLCEVWIDLMIFFNCILSSWYLTITIVSSLFHGISNYFWFLINFNFSFYLLSWEMVLISEIACMPYCYHFLNKLTKAIFKSDKEIPVINPLFFFLKKESWKKNASIMISVVPKIFSKYLSVWFSQ